MDTVFFRLLKHDDKQAALAAAVESVCDGDPTPEVFAVDPSSFGWVPGSPFAYWVSERVRRLFKELPPFESGGRTVKQGLITSDDFRFIRNWWEVPIRSLLSAETDSTQDCFRELTRSGKKWAYIARGGAYSPFFRDLITVVDWEQDGAAIRDVYEKNKARVGGIIKNPDYYFKGGLSWPLRGERFSVQPVPRGAIFSVAGKMATAGKPEELPCLLGIMNSSTFNMLMRLRAGETRAQFEVGLIAKVPVPTETVSDSISSLALEAAQAAAEHLIADEQTHYFIGFQPGAAARATLLADYTTAEQSQRLAAERMESLRESIDAQVRDLYGISEADLGSSSGETTQLCELESTEEIGSGADVSDEEDSEAEQGLRGFAARLMSYFVGSGFGRWDIRFATRESSLPKLAAPFDPLPACSPGMLTDSDGLPANTTPPGYPLRVEWDGIMVDDPDHTSDIVRRVREVLEQIWKDRADAIEKEGCEILGVKELRDYFRKPGKGGFWDDHIARYSKSRRKAPIYWLLQSSKKNYAVWLYCHRLDKDSLFKLLINTVEPKVKNADRELTELRTRRTTATGKEIKQLDRQIEKQDAFVSELRDFEDKLRRAAELQLVPDLNDGVVLTIAPLRELVPWKEAKAYWDELMAGEYAWSSIGKQLREKGLVK